ncbi:MAG: hypothetical protein Q9168_001687 [Polycauliona sp. 1 TL-2023]
MSLMPYIAFISIKKESGFRYKGKVKEEATVPWVQVVYESYQRAGVITALSRLRGYLTTGGQYDEFTIMVADTIPRGWFRP